jgi:hypothetical protein
MLKEIPKSDIITRPFKVYKEWTLDENDISPIFGKNPSNTFVDLDNDEKSQGYNKKVIYASIKSQFYRSGATGSILTDVGRRKSYASKDERVINDDIAVFSIPQVYYGEGIKMGTVSLIDESNGKVYSDDSYSNLIDSGSNVAGNIFYDRGLIVLTRDIISGSILNQFTLNFRSIKTIYENEVFLSVLESEFNYSQNPSAVYEDGSSVNKYIVQRPGSTIYNDLVTSSFYNAGTKYVRGNHFPYVSKLDSKKMGSFDDYQYSSSIDQTGSYLAPFITTIGLYDNELNMVAVAKLPKPIKSMHDYPINFIVRFDT